MKKKAGEPLKRGNVPCIHEAGAEQTAMLVENNWGICNVSMQCSESPRLHSTPYGLLVQRVFRVLLFPSPDTNEMSVVQSLNPQCLVKPLKRILTAA